MSNSGPSLEESLSALSSQSTESFPTPPRLHWASLLLIAFGLDVVGKWIGLSNARLTWISDALSIESVLFLWLLVQASFVQRLTRRNFVSTTLAGIFVIAVPVLLIRMGRFDEQGWGAFLPIVGAGMLLMDLFRMRGALERHYNSVEPYGLSMQGVPLSLLGPIYLQYHLRKIALWKDQRASATIQ